MMIDVSMLEKELDSVYEYIKRELAQIRAGTANPLIVEDIKVKVYGQVLPIKQLGNVSTVDASLLCVQVWDQSVVQDIIKAIQESNLGINPIEDGMNIKLPFPPINEDRRKDLLKLIKEKIEQGKIRARRARQDFLKNIDSQKDDISEDEVKNQKKECQQKIDDFNKKLELLLKEKEESILKI